MNIQGVPLPQSLRSPPIPPKGLFSLNAKFLMTPTKEISSKIRPKLAARSVSAS